MLSKKKVTKKKATKKKITKKKATKKKTKKKASKKKFYPWGNISGLTAGDIKFLTKEWNPTLPPIPPPPITLSLNFDKNMWVVDQEVKLELPKPKTQKAKGILKALNLVLEKYHHTRSFFARVDHSLIIDEDGVKNNTYLPCFARPCPKVPRHGFVDSRPIKSNKDLMKLWHEVKENDPDGEMILGPYLPNVDYNAIFVSSGTLSVGKGNDGATAGKDSISFPVSPHKFTKKILDKAAISEDDAAYMEAIYPKNWERWALTQMRGGPALASVSPDFIPNQIKVEKIVEPHDDLLKWEQDVKDFSPGTVVYGAGHTLASHAAIHCVLHNIPFVTTKKPKIGEILTPNQDNKNTFERRRFKKGVRAGINVCRTVSRSDMPRLFYFSISVLHNWAYLKNSDHADWLLGAASVVLVKLCAALALGEHRHSRENKQNNGETNREKVYVKALNNPTDSLKKLPNVLKEFYSGYWDSGFGGLPWATCTWYSNKLWQKIVNMFNHKSLTISEKEISGIVEVVNRTINLAHNGGWWFNKFTTKEDMDFIAKSPGFAAFCVSDVFVDLYERVQRAKDSDKNLAKPKKINAPCGKDENNNLVWVKIYGADKNTQLALKMEDGKKKSKSITLTKKELQGLRRKYRRDNLDYGDAAVLQVRRGHLRIPGGEPKPLKKVFKW